MISTKLPRRFCIPGLVVLALTSAGAEVRLNEFGASSSERLLTRNEKGVAHLGGGVQWWEAAFDDATWRGGRTPIGFGYGDVATDVRSSIQRVTPTLYVRQEFPATAEQAASDATLSLTVDFDDGFVAYLNGVEIARANAGGTGAHLYADQTAYQANAANGRGITFRLGPSHQFLEAGNNVLAVEVHNSEVNSANLKLETTLGVAGTLFVRGGDLCSWFPGLVSPSGGVFDPSLVFGAPGLPVSPAYEPEFEDWIELYNDGLDDADLSGWGLSDEAGDPLKWIFPAGTILPAGEYLVVLADGREELTGLTTYLHAGFKLAAEGERLTLANAAGEIQSEIPGGYPPQYPTHSFGWDAGTRAWGYFESPTPGRDNTGPPLSDRVDAPDFDVKGGFHDGTVTLTLTSSTPGATIRYTMDGSEPSETHGNLYTGPLTLTAIDNKTGRVVRARAFKSGQIPSKSKSHTYLINQAAQIRTIPALLFTGDEAEVFYRPHGIMAIEGGTYVNDLWQPSGIDSYNIPINRGRQYERPVHLEFYHANGTPGFREDAGIRLAASSYSRPRLRLDNRSASPWPSNEIQKPSFNLYFRNDYGRESFDYAWLGEAYPVTSFEQLRVRAGKNDIRNPWIRDELVRRLYSEMGQASSVGITNTVYFNGSFKGFFNMTERLREPFMQAHHHSSEEWDVRQVSDYAQGDERAWNTMMSLLNRDLRILRNWQAAEAFLDPVNMADYFLLNIYGATWDWPHNNWVGARERSPEGKYRLYVWDAEGAFGLYNNHPSNHDTIGADLLNKNNPLSNLFKRLVASPEWRLIFADRIHRHFFHGGVLDDRNFSGSRIRRHALVLQREFQPILSFVHGEAVNLSFLNTWASANSGRRTYLLGPNRDDFGRHGLWPSVAPPSYNRHGGEVSAGFEVTMAAETGTTIYYTLDGSDPRLPGGAPNPDAAVYEAGVPLTSSRVVVKSRAFHSATRDWSALTEAEFDSGLVVPDSDSLIISEVMYHPADASVSEAAAGFTDQDAFEFIELTNVGTFDLDLADVLFTDGVTFRFADSDFSTLAPGERVLVVADLGAFRQRYGTAMDSRIAGEFGGNLSNGGETVTLSLLNSSVVSLHSFSYLDADPWPSCADGAGHSLVLMSPEGAPAHSEPGSWACSPHFGGELGGDALRFDYVRWRDFTFDASAADDPAVSGPLADPDRDSLNSFGEFALGTHPLQADPPGSRPSVVRTNIAGDDYLILNFRRSRFQVPVTFTMQASTDLATWSDVEVSQIDAAAPVVQADGRIAESWRFLEPGGASPVRYLRLHMEHDTP